MSVSWKVATLSRMSFVYFTDVFGVTKLYVLDSRLMKYKIASLTHYQDFVWSLRHLCLHKKYIFIHIYSFFIDTLCDYLEDGHGHNG